MKVKKKEIRKSAATAPEGGPVWPYLAATCAALFAVLHAYSPSLRGEFVFDDSYLPMNVPGVAEKPLASWILGVRPVLMLTYWLNYQPASDSTAGYHVWNVLLHFGVTVLVFLCVRRLLALASAPDWLAWFASGVFLLHPVQAESVAYIAGRSESLSALFYFAAYALFLYRRKAAAGWPLSAGLLVLLALALGSKEHTITLPALLLLTDWFWGEGGAAGRIKANWRLYGPLAAGAVAGAAFVLSRIGLKATAGFGVTGITWYEYLFTQFRMIPLYVGKFLLPAGLSADYDVPLSRSLADHGAWAGLLFLLAATAAAVVCRKRAPLAAYGWLMFLLLLAPTSSVVPIEDPLVDRRLYLPMIGLLLVACDGLQRIRIGRPALAGSLAVVVLLAWIATYQRSKVWAGTIPLWEDTVAKSPGKVRAHFQLAHAYFVAGRCEESLRHYETAGSLEPPDYRLLVDWALAEDCLNRTEPALARLRQAADMERSAHVYALIGMVTGKAGRTEEAWQALDTAVAIDPHFDVTYVYRGHLKAAAGDRAGAAQDYRKALELNPGNPLAREALQRLGGR